MLVGHGYLASTIGSGGRGSTMFPASGLNSALITVGSPAYVESAAAGGAGGGFVTPGSAGQVLVNTPANPAATGPSAPGGTAVQLFPFPAPTGTIVFMATTPDGVLDGTMTFTNASPNVTRVVATFDGTSYTFFIDLLTFEPIF